MSDERKRLIYEWTEEDPTDEQPRMAIAHCGDRPDDYVWVVWPKDERGFEWRAAVQRRGGDDGESGFAPALEQAKAAAIAAHPVVLARQPRKKCPACGAETDAIEGDE